MPRKVVMFQELPRTGLKELRALVPKGQCLMCTKPLPTGQRGRPRVVCSRNACFRAYHRLYARDRAERQDKPRRISPVDVRTYTLLQLDKLKRDMAKLEGALRELHA